MNSASGISTVFLPENLNELCDRKQLLLQERQVGNIFNIINAELLLYLIDYWFTDAYLRNNINVYHINVQTEKKHEVSRNNHFKKYYVRYSPSEISTINTATFQIYVNIP